MESVNKLVFTLYLLFQTFSIQVGAANAEAEPQCESKCNCDLKLLEKIAIMGTELSQFRETIEKQQANMERQQTEIESLQNELTGLRPKPAIAFLAELTTSMSGSSFRVYFRNVKLNLGNAYIPHHGLFIAPLNGTYLFAITACSKPSTWIVLELVVENTVVGQILAGDNVYRDCNSKQFVVQLKAGNDAFIQHGDGSFLEAYTNPSFMGVLLQAN
ncbi:heavy metal-binding protein HIP-like [Mercenaria mercenaria]|uniref:heavy metal-binding protein HIP-like n=1 Tax=Mercenaria mercenaria TaxID=6596 RepID=UPI00234E49CF|nr:heavy metal-binding protein HIP-like [Mercenaria mercenaria]